MRYRTVLRTAELGPGELREVRAPGEDLVLANVGQTYYALDAHCPLDGTNLAREGRLAGDWLVCPHDGARFDVHTGAAENGAAQLRSYQIRVRGNDVQVGGVRSEVG